MKLSTKLLKKEVVNYLKAHPEIIASQYAVGEEPNQAGLLSEKVWRRTAKEKEESTIRRDFELKEASVMDGLEWAEFLRVEVRTDAADVTILSITVEND